MRIQVHFNPVLPADRELSIESEAIGDSDGISGLVLSFPGAGTVTTAESSTLLQQFSQPVDDESAVNEYLTAMGQAIAESNGEDWSSLSEDAQANFVETAAVIQAKLASILEG